jgi:hypothetical protein
MSGDEGNAAMSKLKLSILLPSGIYSTSFFAFWAELTLAPIDALSNIRRLRCDFVG